MKVYLKGVRNDIQNSSDIPRLGVMKALLKLNGRADIKNKKENNDSKYKYGGG